MDKKFELPKNNKLKTKKINFITLAKVIERIMLLIVALL